jgi:hypothetical protein
MITDPCNDREPEGRSSLTCFDSNPLRHFQCADFFYATTLKGQDTTRLICNCLLITIRVQKKVHCLSFSPNFHSIELSLSLREFFLLP